MCRSRFPKRSAPTPPLRCSSSTPAGKRRGAGAGWPRQTTPGVSDDMILKYTTAGKFVMQIGKSGQSKGNLDTENVHQATDVFVDTKAKEVYAADGNGNKRVIVFD